MKIDKKRKKTISFVAKKLCFFGGEKSHYTKNHHNGNVDKNSEKMISISTINTIVNIDDIGSSPAVAAIFFFFFFLKFGGSAV